MKLCIRYDLYVEECKEGKDYLTAFEIDESKDKISWNGKEYIKMMVRYSDER